MALTLRYHIPSSIYVPNILYVVCTDLDISEIASLVVLNGSGLHLGGRSQRVLLNMIP